MKFEFVMTKELRESLNMIYRYMTIKNLIKGLIYFGLLYFMLSAIIILFG